jgi:hypothetical protein
MALPPATAKPCVECPWRRIAAAGWLGPFSAERWIEIAHSDEAIACHRTIKKSGTWDGASQCRGAAIFRANMFKLPRDPEVVTGPTDTETVFRDPAEFLAHHEP